MSKRTKSRRCALPRRCLVLTRMYERLNRRYFDGKLPPALLAWESCAASDRRRTLARMWCRFDQKRLPVDVTILVSRRLQFSANLVAGRLLHEMAHVATAHARAGHGKKFQDEMKRLALAGAMEKIW